MKKEKLNELEQLYQHKHAEHGIMLKSKPDDMMDIQLIVELPIDAAWVLMSMNPSIQIY